jgi:hypothetical protein
VVVAADSWLVSQSVESCNSRGMETVWELRGRETTAVGSRYPSNAVKNVTEDTGLHVIVVCEVLVMSCVYQRVLEFQQPCLHSLLNSTIPHESQEAMKGKQGVWRYKWVTMSPLDLNTEIWSSRLGVERKSDNLTLQKIIMFN